MNKGKSSGPADDQYWTTGQVATLLKVVPRTVSKLFDRGELQGHKLSASGGPSHRRLSRDSVLEYMRRKGIQIPRELEDPQRLVKRIVIFGDDNSAHAVSESLGEGFDCAEVSDIFDLSDAFRRAAFRRGVDALLLHMEQEAASVILKAVRKRYRGVLVIGFAHVAPTSLGFRRGDFEDWFRYPFDDIELVRVTLNR